MTLKDIMTSQVEVVAPQSNLIECARMMKNIDTGCLPVCENDRLVGMITDRDIVVRCLAEDKDAKTCLVREAMTPGVVYCFEDQSIQEAARIMEVKQIRRLLVLDRNKRLVGICSLGDIAAKTGNEDLSGEVLEKVSEPVRGKAA